MNIHSGLGALPPTVRAEQKSTPPTTELPTDGDRPSGFERFAETLMDTTFFGANELVEVGKNDPALALRYGATTISQKLLEGTGPTVREGFGAAIIPTIRLSILGANAYRLNSTLKDPTAHIAEKGLDVLRVATDLVGLAGSVLKYAMPSKAALGDTLVGVSYAADAVSHSVRLMTHGADRVTVWKKQLAERKATKTKGPSNEVPAPIVQKPLPTPPASTAILLK